MAEELINSDTERAVDATNKTNNNKTFQKYVCVCVCSFQGDNSAVILLRFTVPVQIILPVIWSLLGDFNLKCLAHIRPGQGNCNNQNTLVGTSILTPGAPGHSQLLGIWVLMGIRGHGFGICPCDLFSEMETHQSLAWRCMCSREMPEYVFISLISLPPLELANYIVLSKFSLVLNCGLMKTISSGI